MARQKKEKLNKDFSYQDIIDRLGENEDVSFERIGDTIIMKREEPEEREVQEEVSEATEYESGPLPENVKTNLEDAENKLFLVKKEIEKKRPRHISGKDAQELELAFSRLESRLDSLEREFRSLRVELSYLRGVAMEKLQLATAENAEEKAEYPKMEEVAVSEGGDQVQMREDDIPEMKFEEKKNGSRLGFFTSTISNIYNSFFLGTGEERDEYKEFQKKLFLLVRTQPRSLDDIAYGTGESTANCLIWLTRMVDEGLLEETKQGFEGKRVYRIVWEKVA